MYIFDGPVKFCFSFFVAFCNDKFPVGGKILTLLSTEPSSCFTNKEGVLFSAVDPAFGVEV